MSKKEYEVSVDESTEVVTTKKEVDAIVKEALADGETHEVAVAVVEPEEVDTPEEVVVDSTERTMAPQGIQVYL